MIVAGSRPPVSLTRRAIIEWKRVVPAATIGTKGFGGPKCERISRPCVRGDRASKPVRDVGIFPVAEVYWQLGTQPRPGMKVLSSGLQGMTPPTFWAGRHR